MPTGRAADVAIAVTGVGVRYNLGAAQRRTLRQAFGHLVHGRPDDPPFWAIRDVTFAVQNGDVLGIVGRNGAGKSTLLLTLAGILRPDQGSVRTFGNASTLLTLGAGFDNERTGRENIYLNGAFLGLRRSQIERQFDAIVEFAELGAFIDVRLRKYSSGMRARLGFAIAAHVQPDILLLDEIFAVGDEGFRQKSQEKLDELMQSSKAIVIASHSMAFITEMCNTAVWLDGGKMMAWGPSAQVVARYSASMQQVQGSVRTTG